MEGTGEQTLDFMTPWPGELTVEILGYDPLTSSRVPEARIDDHITNVYVIRVGQTAVVAELMKRVRVLDWRPQENYIKVKIEA